MLYKVQSYQNEEKGDDLGKYFESHLADCTL